MKNKILKLISLLTVTVWMSAVYATPLDATWTQVGHMNGTDGGMFNGNCDLDLTSGCTYGTDASGDFWTPFAGADEILFITSDMMVWGHADYAQLLALVSTPTGDFAPNLTWIDAGRAGVSIGAVVGNVLHRTSFDTGTPEDPWVTLEGDHCANVNVGNPCDEMLWGEVDWQGLNWHSQLRIAHDGVDVYARAESVPEPGTLALLGFGLAGMRFARRKKA